MKNTPYVQDGLMSWARYWILRYLLIGIAGVLAVMFANLCARAQDHVILDKKDVLGETERLCVIATSPDLFSEDAGKEIRKKAEEAFRKAGFTVSSCGDLAVQVTVLIRTNMFSVPTGAYTVRDRGTYLSVDEEMRFPTGAEVTVRHNYIEDLTLSNLIRKPTGWLLYQADCSGPAGCARKVTRAIRKAQARSAKGHK